MFFFEYQKVLVILLLVFMGIVSVIFGLFTKRKPSSKKWALLIFLCILDGAMFFIGCLLLFSIKFLPYLSLFILLGLVVILILSFNERKKKKK